MEKSSKAKIVGLINQKGGVGKTSLLYQLAYTFAHQGKKVLCLDLDPQANLTLLVEQRKKTRSSQYHLVSSFHLYHLLVNSVRELRALHQPVLVSDILIESDGVCFLPAGSELSGLDLTLSQIQTTPKQLVLKRFLERSGLLDQYDFILLDAPPTLGLIMVNILCACEGLLIPFRPDLFSFHGYRLIEDVLDQIQEMNLVACPKILGLLPNMVDERRKQDVLDLQEMAEEVQGKIPLYPALKQKALFAKLNAQGHHLFEFQQKEYAELQEHFLQWATRIATSLVR
jgi:chromosome partitioning protein